MLNNYFSFDCDTAIEQYLPKNQDCAAASNDSQLSLLVKDGLSFHLATSEVTFIQNKQLVFC